VVFPPDTSRLTGVYDVVIEDSAGVVAESVGTAGGSGRELGVTLHPPGVDNLTFDGPIGDDGSLRVDDAFGIVTDVAFFATVEANARQVGDLLLINGTVDAPGAPSESARSFQFEMRRPVGTRSGSSTGAWTFSFAESPGACDCTSTAHLVLEVDDTGLGSTLPVPELDAAEGSVGFFHSGAVLVSPQGMIYIRMHYGTPVAETCFDLNSGLSRPCTIILMGVLREDHGEGTLSVREPLFLIPFGPLRPWSATRNGVTTAVGCSECSAPSPPRRSPGR
jgi:hypothetical protein